MCISIYVDLPHLMEGSHPEKHITCTIVPFVCHCLICLPIHTGKHWTALSLLPNKISLLLLYPICTEYNLPMSTYTYKWLLASNAYNAKLQALYHTYTKCNINAFFYLAKNGYLDCKDRSPPVNNGVCVAHCLHCSNIVVWTMSS